MLLPRDELSLSYLDLTCPNGDLPSSRFFESRIRILELESRMAEKPSVLIARSEANTYLYAIERHDNGLHTVCKLGPWVDLATLYPRATVSSQQLLRLGLIAPRDLGPAPLTTPHLHKEQKERQLAIEALQSVVRKRGRSQSVSTNLESSRQEKRIRSGDAVFDSEHFEAPKIQEEQCVDQTPRKSSEVCQLPASAVETATSQPRDSLPQPTSNDLLDNIRSQYLESLYNSMVRSVAS
jgi:DNA replication regulator SLD3